jgi:hypothetical protein
MSTISRTSSELTFQQVTSIVTLLQKAVKVVCLYPPCNPSCQKAISLFTNELESFLQSNEQLLLSLTEEGFTFEHETVEPTFGDSHRLSKICYDAGVSELAFGQEFTSDSADEVFDIFRKVINKDDGDLELGEALWGKQIPGFSFEIVEDQSYLEFDSEIRREFFDNQGKGLDSGHLSDGNTEINSYKSAFDESKDASRLVEMTSERSKRFEAVVTTISDDASEEEKLKTAQEDASVKPQDLLMRVFELDSREAHATAMALAKDAMFDPDKELLGILDDLLDQDQQIKDLGSTLLTCVKAHAYYIERGSLNGATAILRKLQDRRLSLKKSAPDWEAKIGETLNSVASRERVGAVCHVLNENDNVSAADFASYLSTFDWTAYSTLVEVLGELDRQEHRMALCDFLAGAKEEHVDLIASGLYDKRWFVARNTAIILSNFNCARSHSHLIKTMRHTESRVRLEVVRGCRNHNSAYKSTILLAAISDEDPQVRHSGVETALAQSGDDTFPLFETLLDELLRGEIPKSTSEQVILGYSQAGKSKAVEQLTKVAGAWRIIGRSPHQIFRAHAIHALEINDSDEAESALSRLSKSWCKEIKSLSTAALQARVIPRKEPSR